jgi:hypothetical protein
MGYSVIQAAERSKNKHWLQTMLTVLTQTAQMKLARFAGLIKVC